MSSETQPLQWSEIEELDQASAEVTADVIQKLYRDAEHRVKQRKSERSRPVTAERGGEDVEPYGFD